MMQAHAHREPHRWATRRAPRGSQSLVAGSLARGLVRYHPSMERSGDDLRDLSVNRVHQTLTGQARAAEWWPTPYYDDHFIDAGLVPASTVRTLSCWISVPTTLTGSVRALMGFASTGSNTNAIELRVPEDVFGFDFWNFGNWGFTGALSLLQDDHLHHLVAEFHDNDYLSNRMIIDGVEQTLSEVITGVANRPLTEHFGLGYNGHYTTANRQWQGLFGNIAVYNRALEDHEIHRLYTEPYALLKPEQPARRTVVAVGASFILDALNAPAANDDLGIANTQAHSVQNATTNPDVTDMTMGMLREMSLTDSAVTVVSNDVSMARLMALVTPDVSVSPQPDDVSALLVRQFNLDDVSTGAALPDVVISLGLVYNLLLDTLSADAVSDDLLLSQHASLVIDELIANATLPDITISMGLVYNLMLDALTAAANVADVTVSLSHNLAVDALLSSPSVDDLIASLSQQLTMADSTSLADLPDITVTLGFVYNMLLDSVAVTPTSDDLLFNYFTDLVFENLSARPEIADVAFISKILGQILNPAIISVTPRYSVASVTPRRTVKTLH